MVNIFYLKKLIRQRLFARKTISAIPEKRKKRISLGHLSTQSFILMRSGRSSPTRSPGSCASVFSRKGVSIVPFQPGSSKKKNSNPSFVSYESSFYSHAPSKTVSVSEFRSMLEFTDETSQIKVKNVAQLLYELSLFLRPISYVRRCVLSFRDNSNLKKVQHSTIYDLLLTAIKCPPDMVFFLLTMAAKMIKAGNFANKKYLKCYIALCKQLIHSRCFFISFKNDQERAQKKLWKMFALFLRQLGIEIPPYIYYTRMINGQYKDDDTEVDISFLDDFDINSPRENSIDHSFMGLNGDENENNMTENNLNEDAERIKIDGNKIVDENDKQSKDIDNNDENNKQGEDIENNDENDKLGKDIDNDDENNKQGKDIDNNDENADKVKQNDKNFKKNNGDENKTNTTKVNIQSANSSGPIDPLPKCGMKLSRSISKFLSTDDDLLTRMERGKEKFRELSEIETQTIRKIASLFKDWKTAYTVSMNIWNMMKNDDEFDVDVLLSQTPVSYGDFLVEALNTFAEKEGIKRDTMFNPY